MANAFHRPKVRIVTGPPEGGFFREAIAHLRRPFDATIRALRTWWLLHRGITHARRWRNPFVTTVGILVFGVLAAVFVIWALRGLVVAVFFNDTGEKDSGWWWGAFNPDKACSKIGASCGAANGVVMPVLLLAISTLLFLAWRLGRVRRFCTHKARNEAGSFVQTAGSLMDEVVGRDQLCNAIMNNLRDRKARRPHIVVANVGAGKTALLVRLAEKLASKGAVPIPVRLRDAQGDSLDFCELARQRFQEIVQPVVRSDGEVDRIWRWLRQRADQIVVLGDGLEETLSRNHASGQRDNLIPEIDSVDARPQQNELFGEIRKHWVEFGWGQDPVALREAKIALVGQCGAAARRVAVVGSNTRAYEKLFEIGRCEPDSRVRTAIAQEAGSGGEQAYKALALYEHLECPQHVVSGGRPPKPPGEEPTRQPFLDWVEGQGDRERRAVVRLLERRKERYERMAAHSEALVEREKWYANTMCAWALPMLVDSTMMSRHLGSPRDDLERWIAKATRGDAPDETMGQGNRLALGSHLRRGSSSPPIGGSALIPTGKPGSS